MSLDPSSTGELGPMRSELRKSNPCERNTTDMTVNLCQDFKEFVALLNKHDVRYLVVGGYAVGFHGHPRYTKDLDV